MWNLKNTLPLVSPGNETAWILTGPPYIRPTYPAGSGGESVVRLSLGKLLVNLVQVVKRTNTPLIPQHIILTPMTSGRGSHGHFILYRPRAVSRSETRIDQWRAFNVFNTIRAFSKRGRKTICAAFGILHEPVGGTPRHVCLQKFSCKKSKVWPAYV